MSEDELLYTTGAQSEPMSPVVVVLYLALVVLMIASLWKIFTKAGKPGWAAIIPIYNIVVWLQIVGRPVWWVILYFVPFVNIVVAIIMAHDLSKSFGRGVGTTLLQIFLPFVAYPMLAWGDATYVGPSAGSNGDAAQPAAPAQV